MSPDRSAANPDQSEPNPDRSAANPDRSGVHPDGSVANREASPASEAESAAGATRATSAAAVDWLRTTDWLWMVIGGFYEVGYLFWYVPALAALPESVRDPPEQFPWHWPLDFVATALSGAVLLFLGFRRATDFAEEPGGNARDRGSRGCRSRNGGSRDDGSRGVATSPGGDSGAE